MVAAGPQGKQPDCLLVSKGDRTGEKKLVEGRKGGGEVGETNAAMRSSTSVFWLVKLEVLAIVRELDLVATRLGLEEEWKGGHVRK